ncbi:hypothetical protein CC2G_008149 [Coprinopsis cinerea AmutBmut pab1-1]|nr:hypothetical protein CC2G_008149 [Coprinopsis cinerea AmutBmut pab1-1]
MERGTLRCLFLEMLPHEILLEIVTLASAYSQNTYRSLLLSCRLLCNLTRYPCLPHVPIRIGAHGLTSFHDSFTSNPSLAQQVNHLWITGRSEKVANAVAPCVNLVSLACSSYVLVSLLMTYSLTSPCNNVGLLGPGEIRHRRLRELTLFDNWDCWSYIAQANCGTGLQLCRQITHLRVHDTLAPDFPTKAFPSLTHFSSSTRPLSIFFTREMEILSKLERVVEIVNCTYFWKASEPDERTQDLAKNMDNRVRFLYFGQDEPAEFELWCGRVRGEESIWTRKRRLQMLT